MDNDKKIENWIKQMENEGKSRDDIARGVFISQRSDGTFSVYRLGKSGRKSYQLNVHLGAINLDKYKGETL